MPRLVPKTLMAGLVLLHAGLLIWALMGFAEWFLAEVPWPRVANPLFPPLMLLAHWLSVLVTTLFFLTGFTLRWPGTPVAVACGYVAMAMVCLVETVFFLVHDMRWLAMAAEYAAYIGISLFLFRSAYARERFGRA